MFDDHGEGIAVTEVESEVLRSIGFHSSYENPEAFLKNLAEDILREAA